MGAPGSRALGAVGPWVPGVSGRPLLTLPRLASGWRCWPQSGSVSKDWRSGGCGLLPRAASEQTPGPLPIMTPCFQLDPQALQDRDWQRTVIAMNGVRVRGTLLAPTSLRRIGWPLHFQIGQVAEPEPASDTEPGWRREVPRRAESPCTGIVIH